MGAATQIGGSGSDVLIGPDDDNVNNLLIQPPGTAANQSLNNTDIQVGRRGHDILDRAAGQRRPTRRRWR